MGALAIMVLAFAGYIIMYQLYGKYIDGLRPLTILDENRDLFAQIPK